MSNIISSANNLSSYFQICIPLIFFFLIALLTVLEKYRIWVSVSST